ncbi:MAG: threonine synthase [Myxococcales bacterium]|nr:threonine synthase [Myxococcales bacterium]
MNWISTRHQAPPTTFRDAVLQSLAPDGGLYMPAHIAPLSAAALASLRTATIPEIATTVMAHIIGDEIPRAEIAAMAARAFTFAAPLVPLDASTSVLELFHGPSLAFKDFAAQWMGQLLAYFHQGGTAGQPPLTVLVATSGDTGGAVAAAFHNLPGFRVVILYPNGGVSELQEKQLTSWGDNVAAFAVDGAFDDCQRLVKQAFADAALRAHVPLVSCNSINVARWLPQAVYYFAAAAQRPAGEPLVFCVPSGNLGNLAAGVFAKRLGLPVHRFIAATNANDALPRYLQTGGYEPHPTIATISNAMDVGAPSNSERLFALYQNDVEAMRADILGHISTDDETRATMRAAHADHGMILDPHGAVALHAWQQLRDCADLADAHGIILETAHPAKFQTDVQAILGTNLALPPALATLSGHPSRTVIATDYADLVRQLKHA